MAPTSARAASLALLLLALLSAAPPADAEEQDCSAAALLAMAGEGDLSAAIAAAEGCFALSDTPDDCPSQTVAGAKFWEFHVSRLRDPVEPAYYAAVWSGVTHFDSDCAVTAVHCSITVGDSRFETLSVRDADGNMPTETAGDYHGLAVRGGLASCGEEDASVNTRILGLALLPLEGHTVDIQT